MKSKKPWVCRHGCLVTKEPCKHLEALLPNGRGKKRSVEVVYVPQVEKILGMDSLDKELNEADVAKFVKRLFDHGLLEHHIHVLVDRLVNGDTFADIAANRSYTSVGQVHRVYLQCLEFLRERGYPNGGVKR